MDQNRDTRSPFFSPTLQIREGRVALPRSPIREDGPWGQQWWRPEFSGLPFGSGEAPKPAENTPPAQKPAPSPPVDNTKQIPAGIQGRQTNNYFRADGQNTGNFITDRPSTKVHAAPGGGSSLGYLFGNGGGGSSTENGKTTINADSPL
uniref:Protein SPIRAL1-like 1 n=1 Tax=Ananas comosus var. bracteatus TaxID=296719 RepID=A0A6V7NVJ1_ANACO|nr:unnamed protein product [Ananas comosus var. bracteatus]